MAKLAYNFSTSSPRVKKFKAGTGWTATTQPGIMALVTATAVGGIIPCTTTSGVDVVGHSLDTTVYTTTQSATMVEGVVSILTNPDAVFSYLISGAAASSTALLTTTNTVASAGGTAITITTGDPVPNSPTMLDGYVFGITANNVGLSRKVTTVSATVATVLVPFPFAIAVGDKFIILPFNYGGLSSLGGTNGTLTTTLEQIRQDIASTTTGVTLRHLDLFFDFQGTVVTTATAAISPGTFLQSMVNDHIYSGGT